MAKDEGPRVPMPPELWARLEQFLAAGRTGSIVLHVKEGQIKTAEMSEHLRPSDPVVAAEAPALPPLKTR